MSPEEECGGSKIKWRRRGARSHQISPGRVKVVDTSQLRWSRFGDNQLQLPGLVPNHCFECLQLFLDTTGFNIQEKFLDAFSYLYKTVCPTIRPSVRHPFFSNARKRVLTTFVTNSFSQDFHQTRYNRFAISDIFTILHLTSLRKSKQAYIFLGWNHSVQLNW